MNDCHLFTSSDFEKNIFSLSFIGIKFVTLLCFKINTELEGDEKIRLTQAYYRHCICYSRRCCWHSTDGRQTEGLHQASNMITLAVDSALKLTTKSHPRSYTL